MKYLFRSGGLSGFLDLAEKLGLEPVSLLEAVGFSPAVIQDPDVYLSYPSLARLLSLTAEQAERDDIGVLLAQRQGLEITGALGSQLCIQKDIREALQIIQRNLDFHARGCIVEPQIEGREIVLEMNFVFAREVDCRQLTALSLGILRRGLSQLRGGSLCPVAVELCQNVPERLESYEALFSSPIAFNQRRNILRYPLSLLNKPIDVEPNLRRALDQQWRRNARGQLALSLGQQVERAIIALLPTGDCELEVVARLLELHPRVLQKRLKSTDSSFSEILRKVREQLAKEHLERSEINLTELALHLGFAELSVFSRNFKAWTGVSPSYWRKQSSLAETSCE